MKLVTVQTFDNAIDMHLLKSKLESEGIHCFVFDEHTVALNPIMSQGIGGIKLKVNEKNVEKALLILQKVHASAIIDDEGKSRTCPKCGSADFYVNYKSMKGAKGFLSMTIMFVLLVFPLYYKNVFKCKTCNHEFK